MTCQGVFQRLAQVFLEPIWTSELNKLIKFRMGIFSVSHLPFSIPIHKTKVKTYVKILVSEAGGLFGVVADLGKVGHDFAVPDKVWLTTNVLLLSFCWICKKKYILSPGVPFRVSVHN